MQNIEDSLPYYFHESEIVNLHLSKELFYFRFALPEYYAYHEHPEIKDKANKCLIVDVICKNNTIENFWLDNGLISFIGAEVLSFEIDAKGNGLLFIDDCYQSILEFHCESYEVKDVAIADWKAINLKNVIEIFNSEWHKLPIKEK